MVDIVSEILKRIEESEKGLTQAIASGVNIHTFDAFQRMVGKREGLCEALALINDILAEDEDL